MSSRHLSSTIVLLVGFALISCGPNAAASSDDADLAAPRAAASANASVADSPPATSADDAATEPGVSPDPNLPRPLTTEHFSDFLENSPFTRALNLSESLMLTGLARLEGKPVATLMDRESKETYVISEIPNPQGWKLVEVSSATGAGLETVSATISVGGEVVTVRYDERQLKPGEGKPAGGGKGGKDNRPAPTEAEKKAFGKMVHNRWKALSKEQQERAKKLMGEKMKNPDLSDRQKGELVVKILDHVESDRGGKSRR